MSNALRPYHPVKTAAAILLMLMFLICIGLLVWASNKGATVNGPVHIAANSARVCVTLNDEILVLDTHGALQEHHALEAAGIAAYPIDLSLKHDGTLLVATQRPAGLHICDSMGWQCRAVESPVFKQLRRQIKVQPDPTLERADLLIYDVKLGAKARIKLPADVRPTDVARSGNGMLVTDRDGFRIMRVDINSHAVTLFGDHRVQAILGAASREKANAERMLKPAIAGMVVFAVLMIAMAFWASPKGRRFSPRPKVPVLEPVGVELLFMRQWASEKAHRSSAL